MAKYQMLFGGPSSLSPSLQTKVLEVGMVPGLQLPSSHPGMVVSLVGSWGQPLGLLPCSSPTLWLSQDTIGTGPGPGPGPCPCPCPWKACAEPPSPQRPGPISWEASWLCLVRCGMAGQNRSKGVRTVGTCRSPAGQCVGGKTECPGGWGQSQRPVAQGVPGGLGLGCSEARVVGLGQLTQAVPQFPLTAEKGCP